MSGKFVFCQKIKVFSTLKGDSIVENFGVVRERSFNFVYVTIFTIIRIFLHMIFVNLLLFFDLFFFNILYFLFTLLFYLSIVSLFQFDLVFVSIFLMGRLVVKEPCRRIKFNFFGFLRFDIFPPIDGGHILLFGLGWRTPSFCESLGVVSFLIKGLLFLFALSRGIQRFD